MPKPVALLIEDDPNHLEIFSRFFHRWGWDVVCVDNSGYRVPVPDNLALIVVDRAVPPLSGRAVLQQLRDDGATARAVVVTAMPLDIVANEFDGLGVEQIIDKTEAYRQLATYAGVVGL